MNKKQIGEIVAMQRAENKLTQNQLAEKISVRRQSIIEIEQNQFNYRVDRLLEVLDGLGLELLIVKKDSKGAITVTSADKASLDTYVFRGVEPLLTDPDEKKAPKKKIRK